MQVGFEHMPPSDRVQVDTFNPVKLVVAAMARAYALRVAEGAGSVDQHVEPHEKPFPWLVDARSSEVLDESSRRYRDLRSESSGEIGSIVPVSGYGSGPVTPPA